jgi:ankyrin repeat protein
MAELLISNGADVNRLDDYGTPLHGAATGDKESLAQFLIDHGADVCASDGDQLRTPLHIAARNGSVYVLRLLIKNGADVNARDDDRNTPLHYAAESEYTKKSKHAWMSKHTRQVVEELMKNGADVNAANVTGDTPLHLAARTGAAPVENIEELVELAELFISNGADVNAANDLEGTPLHIASHNSAIFVARLLIKNGADVNARDYAGKTPLHYAAESEITGIGKHAFKIASELLKNGANVNAQDNMGDTPLHLAASVGETIIVKKLVDSGADVDLRNSVDQKPEDRILENGLGRSVETHIRAGIPQWIVILSRKRKQLIVIDDYGIVDKSKWRDELKYFVNKVLLQKEGGFNDPHRQWLLNNGKSIGLLIDCVDNAVDDWEEFRKEQTAYQETSYKEDMDPIVYEYLCANLLAAGGWQTKVTAASSDQGVDVFAQSNFSGIAV